MMFQYLITDLVILEQQCNSRCLYCLTQDSQLKQSHIQDRVEGKMLFVDKDETACYQEGRPLKILLDEIIAKARVVFDAPFLLMSGGEMFLTERIIDFIQRVAQIFPVVQVLSNGTLLTETLLERIAGLKNVHLAVTLDGHTLELNSCRTQEPAVLQRILANIALIDKYRIPMEIFCVVTNRNCHGILSYVEYLARFSKVKFFPFPVRGTAMENFWPGEKEIEGFELILEQYDKYREILLPQPYLLEMLRFLRNPRRTRRCYLPQLTGQLFHDGIYTPCPFGWTTPVANLLTDDEADFRERVAHNSFKKMTGTERVFLPYCKKCFNHLDLLNLFMDQEITTEQIEQIPLFAVPAVKKRLLALKEKLQEVTANGPGNGKPETGCYPTAGGDL